MRKLCVGKDLINGKLGFHYGVVGGSEYGFYAVAYKRLRGKAYFINSRSSTLDHFDAFRFKEFLCRSDRGCGRILTDVVKHADFFDVGVLRKDKVHYRVGVEVVGCAGYICAGRFKRIDKLYADRVGNSSEYDGNILTLGCRLHCHCNGGCDTYHKINVIGNEICDYL